MTKGSRNNLQCCLMDSSSKTEKKMYFKNAPCTGYTSSQCILPSDACCIHSETLTKAQRSGLWSWDAGVSQLITGWRKKHPRALTAQLCMSHQCPLRKAGTGDVSEQKTLYMTKAMSMGRGRSSRGQRRYGRMKRNESFDFKLPRKLKLKKNMSRCIASCQGLKFLFHHVFHSVDS